MQKIYILYRYWCLRYATSISFKRQSSGMAERAGTDHNSLKKFTRNLYHASVAILFENCGREKWTLNIHDLIDLSNNCSDLLPLTVPAENAPHGCWTFANNAITLSLGHCSLSRTCLIVLLGEFRRVNTVLQLNDKHAEQKLKRLMLMRVVFG